MLYPIISVLCIFNAPMPTEVLFSFFMRKKKQGGTVHLCSLLGDWVRGPPLLSTARGNVHVKQRKQN
jgi:hypothetical protein